jgi:nitroreductase
MMTYYVVIYFQSILNRSITHLIKGCKYIVTNVIKFLKALRWLILDHKQYNMDTFECLATKLEVREFSPQDVQSEVRLNVLEAARLTGTGLNTQHWRFVLVENKDNLKKLAQDSTSGRWVAGANFAIIVLTNPKYNFHLIDAGRVIQNMQLEAWNHGVGSGLFTGIKEAELRNDFRIPQDLSPTVIVGFGYPARKFEGKRKNRLPLNELIYYEKYGNTEVA